MRRTTILLLMAGTVLGTLAARGGRPESVVGLLHRSRLEVGATNYAAALEHAQTAVRLDPAYGEAWKQQGRVLMLLNQPAVAESAFATARELMPEDADIPRWLLHQQVDQGRNEEVLRQLEGYSDPQLAEVDEVVIVRMLSDLLDAGAREGAQRLAARWARVGPNDTSRRACGALAQLLGGQTAAAEQALGALKVRKDEGADLAALAWDQVGQAHLSARDPKRALTSFQKALAIRPEALSPLRNLGWAYRADRQPAEAVAAWQKGVAARSNAVEWLAWIAEAQLDLRRPADAARSAAQLMEARPDSERALQLRLASLLILLKGAGVEAFERQAGDTPRGVRTIHLAYATAERYQKKYPEAARRLEELYQADATDPDVKRLLIDTYALWAASVNKLDAVRPLERILDIEPGHPGALRDLGWVYWARGERDKGIDLLDRAIRGGVNKRDEVMNQVYASLVEVGQGERGLQLLRAWAPPSSMLALGRELFERGRLQAAEPALEAAWEAKEDPAQSGLLLAQCRALSGRCYGLDKLLAPYLARPLQQAPAEEIDLLCEALEVCGEAPRSLALLKQMERDLGRRPAPSDSVTDLLERAAERRRLLRDYGHALRLYKRVLARDPNRLCWVRAADSAEALGRRAGAAQLLQDTLARTSSDAVRHGIAGKLAEYEHDLKKSVKLFARSIEAEPEQPELRYNLFANLVALGRFKDAREQVTWFVQKHDSGDMRVRTHLAEMWTALGETDDALQFWATLSANYPDSPYYSVEQARALFRLGRPEEAIAILNNLNARLEDVRSYELLAEIHVAMDRSREAIASADRGLNIELTPGLLRWRAAAAETSGAYSSAYETANALLTVDPGNADMARLLGTSLLAMNEPDEARDYFTSLTNRNPAFLPALLGLQEVAARQRQTEEQVRAAQAVVAQRPWDLEAQRRYANALARHQTSEQALATLQPFAEGAEQQPVPVLVYRDVTRSAYPGRNRADQVVEHIVRLHKEGYAFVTPDQLDFQQPPAQKSVMLIVADADPQSLKVIDQALAEHGGRATYAGFTTAEERDMAGRPTRQELDRLASSGRWLLASSGPPYLRRIAVDTAGTQGNPLTQRQVTASETGRETDEEMQARLDAALADMAAPLSANAKVLLYPRGDYGQLSLDTDPQAVENLRAAAARHFTQAYASDESGFVTRESDPLRRPAKMVPPQWRARDVMAHLEKQNPYANLLEQYARLQREGRQGDVAAATATREAEFNWDAYTFEQGDETKLLALLEQSYARRVYDTTAQETRELARRIAAPTPNAFYSVARDDENRRHIRAGTTVRGRVANRAQVDALFDYNWWKKDQTGDEDGLRTGAGGRWYFRPQYWIDGRLYRMDYRHEGLRDFWGGFVRLRVPNALLNGDVTLEASRDEVGTAEAIRAAIEQWHYALRSYSRIWDDVDVFVNGSITDRDDGNQTWTLDGKMVWPLKRAWPFVGIGPYVRIADSDRDPEAYYAPEDLQQFQLFGTFRGGYRRLTYTGSLQGGVGHEQGRDWRFIWSGRLLAELELGRSATPFGEIKYQEAPAYERYQVSGGLNFDF